MKQGDNPELDAALRATAGLCHDEMQHLLTNATGARIKLLTIAAMTDKGPITMVWGCTCPGCATGLLMQLGRALGGDVELDPQTELATAVDAAGQVH